MVDKKTGTVDRYFETAHPTGGSLMKPDLLRRGATFGELLLAAECPPSTPVHAVLRGTFVDRPGGENRG